MARALLVIALGLSALPFVLSLLSPAGRTADLAFLFARQLSFLSFGFVGYVVAVRQPTNPVAWLLIAIGIAVGFQASIGTAAALLTPPAALEGAMWALFLVAGNILLGLIPLAIVLFPNGRLPARALRLLVYALTPIYVAYGAFNVLGARGLGDAPNPFFVEAFAGEVPLFLRAGVVIAFFTALASPAWRWWRAAGVERSQLKWMALAGILALGLLSVSTGNPWTLFLMFSLFPAAAGIAILRDKLFNIDFVINRSVLYSLVAIVLIAALELVASAAEQLLGPAQREQLGFLRPLLVVAVLPGFRPLERRLRPVVDRMLPMTERIALLFADIVGSTEVAGTLGDARWGELLARYYATIRRELQRFGGVEVQTTGDGFKATFRDPLSAARCALSLTTATSDLGLPTRFGLHIGDFDMRGGEPGGINVHLTARVMTAADAGTVLVSESYQGVLAGSGAAFEALGPRHLKGIPGEVHLYRLTAASLEPARHPRSGPSPASAGPACLL